MMRKLILFLLCLIAWPTIAQNLLGPTEFLGYPLGSRYSFYEKIEDYCDYLIEEQPSNFQKVVYGQTPEGRTLFVLIHGTKENLDDIEQIRRKHLINIGLKKGLKTKEKQSISWLSFNVHGDEAANSETALKLLHHLANHPAPSNQVIIIEPCLNPDGRERYVQWFTGIHQQNSTYDKNAAELNQPWPDGRYNHFLSDLNRDWVWQVQAESQQRLKLYHEWMPHIHADFHEMEPEKSYFFPPPAEPVHEVIAPWQISKLETIGSELKTLFNEKKWAFFNEKEFDLLYPSYGDTYATYNGALGLTLEQGGSDLAGLLYIKNNGDTLSLSNRIEKHFAVAKKLLSTISKNTDSIIQHFEAYYTDAQKNGNGKFKTYVIKNNNAAKLKVLTEQLDRLQIKYAYAAERIKTDGYDYYEKHDHDFTIEINDLIISSFQPKGHLVRVLFEPHTQMGVVKTYDISSWALPYLHHLESYALPNKLNITVNAQKQDYSSVTIKKSKAIAVKWTSAAAVKWSSLALKENVNVLFDTLSTTIYIEEDELTETLLNNARNWKLDYHFINKKEWRSLKLQKLEKPKIGLIIGSATDEVALGDVLVYLEKHLEYPFTQIWASKFSQLNLARYDVLIFPNGQYGNLHLNNDGMKRWIGDGGKLILLENGLRLTNKLDVGLLTRQNLDEISYSKAKNKADNLIQGAFFNIDIHPRSSLKYGLSEGLNVLLNDIPKFKTEGSKSSFIFELNISNHLSGFVGQNVSSYLDHTFLFGTYYFGNGSIIQMTINPLFRGILEDGKILMGNALFMPSR